MIQNEKVCREADFVQPVEVALSVDQSMRMYSVSSEAVPVSTNNKTSVSG